MDQTQIGLFDLAERRLSWADRRQGLLAQNIANANTPGYRPHDLRSFASTLDSTGMWRRWPQPNHMSGTAGTGQQTEARIASRHPCTRR